MSSSRNSENDLNHYSSLEQDEEDRITFKTSDQLKFETLILRFGKVCLLCSSLLFVGQIVSAAVRRHPETSPLVTGFILSLLLFLVWLCIDKTYGETNGESTNHSLLYAFKQPVSMKFRIRSIEEMRLILPHKVCS